MLFHIFRFKELYNNTITNNKTELINTEENSDETPEVIGPIANNKPKFKEL